MTHGREMRTDEVGGSDAPADPVAAPAESVPTALANTVGGSNAPADRGPQALGATPLMSEENIVKQVRDMGVPRWVIQRGYQPAEGPSSPIELPLAEHDFEYKSGQATKTMNRKEIWTG